MYRSAPKPVDILLSLRFNATGPKKEAEQVKRILVERKINAVIINTEAGNNIETEVANALNECKLAVLFANEDYGEETSCDYSTHGELVYIKENNKPFFLIKMCDSYKSPKTRLKLPNAILSTYWEPGTPIPPDLISQILEKYRSVKSMTISPSTSTIPAPVTNQSVNMSLEKELISNNEDNMKSTFTAPVRTISVESKTERSRSRCSDDMSEDQTQKITALLQQRESMQSTRTKSAADTIAATLDRLSLEFYSNTGAYDNKIKRIESDGMNTPTTTSSTNQGTPLPSSSPYTTLSDRKDFSKTTGFSR